MRPIEDLSGDSGPTRGNIVKRVAPAHSRRQIGLITGRKAVLIVVGGASSRRHFRDGSSDSGPTREDMEKLTALTDGKVLFHEIGVQCSCTWQQLRLNIARIFLQLSTHSLE